MTGTTATTCASDVIMRAKREIPEKAHQAPESILQSRIRRPSAGSRPGQRRGRWPDLDPALGQSLAVAGLWPNNPVVLGGSGWWKPLWNFHVDVTVNPAAGSRRLPAPGRAIWLRNGAVCRLWSNPQQIYRANIAQAFSKRRECIVLVRETSLCRPM